MNAKTLRIVKLGLLIGLMPLAAAIVGCAGSGDTNGAGYPPAAMGTPYQPVKTCQVQAPPTLHYYAPSGMGAINSSFMNRLR
jgi:hypothetical protein